MKRPCGTKWLFFASKKFDASFVLGVRDVLNVGTLFLTYPVFFALFEQMVRKKFLFANKNMLKKHIFGFNNF